MKLQWIKNNNNNNKHCDNHTQDRVIRKWIGKCVSLTKNIPSARYIYKQSCRISYVTDVDVVIKKNNFIFLKADIAAQRAPVELK